VTREVLLLGSAGLAADLYLPQSKGWRRSCRCSGPGEAIHRVDRPVGTKPYERCSRQVREPPSGDRGIGLREAVSRRMWARAGGRLAAPAMICVSPWNYCEIPVGKTA